MFVIFSFLFNVSFYICRFVNKIFQVKMKRAGQLIFLLIPCARISRRRQMIQNSFQSLMWIWFFLFFFCKKKCDDIRFDLYLFWYFNVRFIHVHVSFNIIRVCFFSFCIFIYVYFSFDLFKILIFDSLQFHSSTYHLFRFIFIYLFFAFNFSSAFCMC